MKLRKIGRISHLSKSGFLVVSGKDIPKIGVDVYNRKLEKVGYVYDIIGPVKTPFILIRPKDRGVLKRPISDELFVVEGEDHGKGKGKGKGGRKGKRGRGKRNRKGRSH
jgi:RNA-binding protein